MNVPSVTETDGLSDLLIRCRVERDLTIPDVARAVKMSIGAISNIERGIGKTRRTSRMKIERFLRNHGYFVKVSDE